MSSGGHSAKPFFAECGGFAECVPLDTRQTHYFAEYPKKDTRQRVRHSAMFEFPVVSLDTKMSMSVSTFLYVSGGLIGCLMQIHVDFFVVEQRGADSCRIHRQKSRTMRPLTYYCISCYHATHNITFFI